MLISLVYRNSSLLRSSVFQFHYSELFNGTNHCGAELTTIYTVGLSKEMTGQNFNFF